MTIFDAIYEGKVPAQIVYEDEKCLAFRDVNPQAKTHILLIPKTEYKMGHLMVKIPKIAAQEGLKDGYRVVINDGK